MKQIYTWLSTPMNAAVEITKKPALMNVYMIVTKKSSVFVVFAFPENFFLLFHSGLHSPIFSIE